MPPSRRSRFRARWVAAVGLAFIVVVVVLIVAIGGSSSRTTGYDASYPQCSGSYPPHPLFGIVGVNGGLANNANPCVSGELRWARDTPGQTQPKQPPLSLYIDTANPGGGHHVADWPSGGTTPVYGACNSKLTNACSYIYGEQRAAHSYRLAAALDPAAETAPWWLDVEVVASWAGTYQLNIAALQGFIAGLRNAGATGPIGIYSTRAQWHEITGLTAQTTRAVFNGQLPDWVAGTKATLTQAQQNCANGGFTGVAPTLAQYRNGQLDADLRCSGSR